MAHLRGGQDQIELIAVCGPDDADRSARLRQVQADGDLGASIRTGFGNFDGVSKSVEFPTGICQDGDRHLPFDDERLHDRRECPAVAFRVGDPVHANDGRSCTVPPHACNYLFLVVGGIPVCEHEGVPPQVESVELEPRPEIDALLEAFLGRVDHPNMLLIEGEPGIGKTTAWGLTVHRAWQGGIRVLASRGAESETSLAFCGLTDLFADALGELEQALPPAAMVALRAAIDPSSRPAAGVDSRQIGLAVSAAVRELARNDLLLALDDVQWLDRPTIEALCFAIRRLGDVGVRVLLCARKQGDSRDPSADRLMHAMPVQGAASVTLGGFSEIRLARIVRNRIGVQLGARQARLLAEQVAGNPFWALELAGRRNGAATDAAPPTDSGTDILQQRIRDLPSDLRTVLATVAGLSRPTVDKAIAALQGFVADPDQAIDQSVDAGIITESSGMLRPVHPLLGSAALTLTPPVRRRRMHARFAELSTDPEQRAHHLAQTIGPGPDAELAVALDEGVDHARNRGAVHVAADLADQAVLRTPPSEVALRVRRLLTAAELNFSAGDLPTALGHVEGAWHLGVDDQQWSRMVALLVELTYWVKSPAEAESIAGQILREHQDENDQRLVALTLAADVGDGRGTPKVELATAAVDLADRVADPDPWAVSQSLLYLISTDIDSGRGLDERAVERARIAEREWLRRRPHWIPVITRVDTTVAYFRKIVDDLDGARAALGAAIETAMAEGDDSALTALLGHLALTECWAGNYPAALDAADRGAELAMFGGAVVPVVLHAARGLTLVHTGRIAAAREILDVHLPGGTQAGPGIRTVVLSHVAGLVDLLQGRPAEAADILETAYRMALQMGIKEPGRRQRLEGDLGEAWARTARWAELEDLADEQIQFGERTGRPVIAGVGYRLAAMAAGGLGDQEKARAAAAKAVKLHADRRFPLDLARSQLVLARILRRQRARGQAAQVESAARTLLAELGAKAWLDREDSVEIDPAALATVASDLAPRNKRGKLSTADLIAAGLTATERRVAGLAAAGRSNREVAAELFISVRTAEGHLSAVYRKLHLRGRAELAAHVEPED
jgi:DNA-binding CsgD family transcriptional regulator